MTDVDRICNDITLVAENHLPLEKWGFAESGRIRKLDNSTSPSIIYSSELCKLKISFNEFNPPFQTENFSIHIYYGRHTASDEKDIDIVDGTKCYCWHDVAKPLHFIDDASPDYVAKNIFSHELIEEFRKSVSSKDLQYKSLEWGIRKHAVVWEKYAPRLFELFDVQKEDLWQKYRDFLKDVYDIRGRSAIIQPSMDNVC